MRVGVITIAAYVSLETVNLLMSDENDVARFLGIVAPGVAKAIASQVVGHFVGTIALGLLLPVGTVVVAGIAAGVVTGWILDEVFGEEEEKRLGEHIRGFLEDFNELNQEFSALPPNVGDDGSAVP